VASVFDDPRVAQPPPTIEEFEQRLGDPLFSFTADQRDLIIPQGLLACCHVVHQPHCEYHVALTLIGCEFDIVLPDGEVDARHPARQTFEGDVVARPLDFSAAVQSVLVLAEATADAEGGHLARVSFDVWTLNLELAAMWRYLLKEQEGLLQAILERSDKHSTAWIEALPIGVLDPSVPGEVARTMGRPSFRHVRAYARRVIVLPNEIGHDDEYRYVTDLVGGQVDRVAPAVTAIRRDPREASGGAP
jgi:hypothetical protein